MVMPAELTSDTERSTEIIGSRSLTVPTRTLRWGQPVNFPNDWRWQQHSRQHRVRYRADAYISKERVPLQATESWLYR